MYCNTITHTGTPVPVPRHVYVDQLCVFLLDTSQKTSIRRFRQLSDVSFTERACTKEGS